MLVLPVTPEITASFVAATEAAPAYRAGRVGPGLWALVSGGGAALTLGPGLGR